ncbi:Hypothetical predicted protein [Mytilus galloprovincialis]|uniref:Uncharacterized protein n=1 Tax=Mytilus galloprovincialis TaxID=29158 RepID=A0A8B6FY14_MYTGA|nr:Hypothetical predicted protein [Mytilus galloprovincialis]
MRLRQFCLLLSVAKHRKRLSYTVSHFGIFQSIVAVSTWWRFSEKETMFTVKMFLVGIAVIHVLGQKGGEIFEKYNSAVGNAENFYLLLGRCTIPVMEPSNCIIGFVVAWNNEAYGNSNSATSFTGTYYEDTDKIYTFWILTRYTMYADMWASNHIGQNVFTRIPSNPTDIVP